MNKLAPRDVIE
jgi:hypothetical protein